MEWTGRVECRISSGTIDGILYPLNLTIYLPTEMLEIGRVLAPSRGYQWDSGRQKQAEVSIDIPSGPQATRQISPRLELVIRLDQSDYGTVYLSAAANPSLRGPRSTAPRSWPIEPVLRTLTRANLTLWDINRWLPRSCDGFTGADFVVDHRSSSSPFNHVWRIPNTHP